MKTIKYNILTLLAILTLGAVSFSSCSDEPDAENYYTFTGKMMSEYIKGSEDFSQFAAIVDRAGLMDQLSAYGHYTCFLPNNEAVSAYLQKKGVTLDNLSKEDCDTIARTHIMDQMYSITDMADGMLPSQNMLDRNVQIEHTVDANQNSIVKLNGNSNIFFEHQDDSVENGIVHQIDMVLENSAKTVGTMLSSNERTSIFAEAIHLTGIDADLDLYEDVAYRERYENGDYVKVTPLVTGSRVAEDVYCPERKLYGFTAFVVPDDVLKQRYSQYFNGMVSDVQALYNLAVDTYKDVWPEDVDKEGWKFENLSDPINPLKRFLQYHILNRNCQGYNFLTVRENAGVDIDICNPTEWYTTLLPYSLMKVEKLTVAKWLGYNGVQNDIYLNRRYDDNHWTTGVHVSSTVESEYDNNAVNGMYFYIDDILKFDTKTIDDVFTCRMRLDFSTVFPEIQTNNMRMNGNSIGDDNVGKNYYFPQGYLDGVILRGDSRLTYWYAKAGYYSAHGDEMDAQDVFDITFNLPPIPYTGEWQIRLGFAPMSKADGAERGQVQVYVDDKAQGIPLNMEERLNDQSIYGTATYPSYNSIRDDADKRQEDFKILKNKGYYRAPYGILRAYTSSSPEHFTENYHMARKVLCTLRLEAGKNHTIRLKNVSTVLPKKKEAMLDYLELVPKSVYGVSDGDAQEDDL